MIAHASLITFENTKREKIMSTPSLYDHKYIQLDSTMNYFSIFQRDLNSFNNNALYIGRDFTPANPKDLIPQAVKAFLQIQSRIQDAQLKGLHAAHERAAADYQSLWDSLGGLGIRKEFRTALRLTLVR